MSVTDKGKGPQGPKGSEEEATRGVTVHDPIPPGSREPSESKHRIYVERGRDPMDIDTSGNFLARLNPVVRRDDMNLVSLSYLFLGEIDENGL